MPGKRSDSEPVEWQQLRLTEQGGFAGLLRAAELRASELDPLLVTRVAQLVGRARAGAGRAADYPDGQSLSLEVQTASGTWTAQFDTADLPAAIEDLKALLTLKPISPPKG